MDLIVVPARFGSTRLPGKPLIPIAGHSLLARVAHVARAAAEMAGRCDVVIATDDPRVADHAASLGYPVTMTASNISSGSGRAFAAAMQHDKRPDIVVNLQGDTPFIPAAMVAALISAARENMAACVTPVVRLDWKALDAMRAHKQRSPFSGTTCVRNSVGKALWFSKEVIPAIRDEAALREQESFSPIFRHLGLYAYRLEALERFEAEAPSRYEQLEGLEQLRFLEMGLDVQTIEVTPPDHAMSGIDTAEDILMAEALIRRFGDPHGR
ncbi:MULTISPECIES: 3-deoxy-manno-octulosonate cytidylyltransferase [unclassified Sphingomonas]|uniref:3-deoxy-manno-octulosonate cytidylyltransferase n=1 Tax=unclassified Sphingomonas TaxID=196159 RepID=UPI002859245B|nr:MULTISPECIES: 3-deoxy-manno-octulosonate cytidylyltransferase [unclassified Sphingomonas]MDR6116743.1 3-deoxy-manno-octulosonate cytidylyltransferase (CMP-KDO synthetase) [Sphingomonas sp. SORGH_AS_0789]MDR6151817.1 3-deoxy-manno-octulosonate cytidylyltransferase (CMP-KDO synthetase) [Sphingomonas sp. SORGH_AS_0742]